MPWTEQSDTVAPPITAPSGSPSSNATAIHEIGRLEARIEKLLLINRAMWILLQRQSNFTDEQLAKLVDHLDNQDGQLDGRNRRAAANCPKCQAVISPKYNRCLFCGEPGAVETVFDAV